MYNLTKLISSIGMLIMISCGSSHGTEDGTGGSGFVFSGGSTSVSDAGIGGGLACAQQQVPLQALPPDILIVQDRSLSMNDDSDDQSCNGGCGIDSKWSQVTVAIKNVTATTQDKVNWGLFYFGNGSSMCGVNTNPDVQISSGNSTEISASLDYNSPNGATPTASTINNAVSYLKTLNDNNPKYLLLATDGEPNCLNGNVNSKDVSGAISSITSAKDSGFPVFVVGIGNVAVATNTLNSMAQAGGMQQSVAGTSYYAASDTASLEVALNKIVGIIASCTISLENVPRGQWSMAIWATDSSNKIIQIPNSNNDGWAYTDTNRSSITLVGTPCESLKNGSYSNLQFVYTCQDQQIIPPPQ